VELTEKEIQSLEKLAKSADGLVLKGVFERFIDELGRIPQDGEFDKEQLFVEVTSRIKARSILQTFIQRMSFYEKNKIMKAVLELVELLVAFVEVKPLFVQVGLHPSNLALVLVLLSLPDLYLQNQAS